MIAFSDAANDAHCALSIYDKILSIATENAVELVPLKYASAVATTTPINAAAQKSESRPLSVSSTLPSTISKVSSEFMTMAISPSVASIPDLNNSAKLNKFSGPLAASINSIPGQVRQRPQHIRAYCLWYHKSMPLKDMCATLRSPENPLKESTVM